MTTSWKTTLFGAIAALGVYFTTVPSPSWVPIMGQVMLGAGTFLTGMFAKDSNVSNAASPVASAKVTTK